MSKTTKTVVIVGVAAILLFVVISMSQPKVVNSTTNSSGAGYLPGLFALGAGLGKALSSSPPAVSTPYTNEGTYRTDTGSTISGNTLLSDSGKPLSYGTD